MKTNHDLRRRNKRKIWILYIAAISVLILLIHMLWAISSVELGLVSGNGPNELSGVYMTSVPIKNGVPNEAYSTKSDSEIKGGTSRNEWSEYSNINDDDNKVDFFNEILIDAFPEYNESDILTDPSSPQAKAFNWILNHDTYFNHIDVNVSSDGKYQSAIIQRYVLAVLFFSTDGEIHYDLASTFTPDANREQIWTTEGHFHFLSNRHECEWFTFVNGKKYGVADCTKDLNIKEIYLKRLGLSGYLPTEIRMLQQLERFNISDNFLSGTIPDMDGMDQLQLLDISHNKFVGKLPQSIGTLMSLQRLRVHSNHLFGADAIPASLCQSVYENSGLLDFWADCRSQIDPVQCECCNVCCDGQEGGCMAKSYYGVYEERSVDNVLVDDDRYIR